ncbi:nucleolar complex protein 3, partial [Lecanoromycetidae sp. Uapishka_2]
MAIVQTTKRRKLSPSDEGDLESLPFALVKKNATQDDYLKQAARWNLEQNYEQRPRKQRKREQENTRLPIKTAEGRIEQLQAPQAKSEDEDSWLDSGDEDEHDHVPDTVNEEEVKVPIRQQILDAKEELAKIASLINEDPEEHAGAFRTLGSIATSSNPTVKRLALVTQLAVYKDAIPGYRIRPIAEVDQTEKVSKDVRRLRAFEQTLVSSYQAYINDLSSCAKPTKAAQTEAEASVVSVALSCACALLQAVPHFNFRGELLKILVAKLSSRKVDENFVKCREAIERLFRNDDDGTSSLDAVSLITRMMKARNYQVDESALNTFLHLRLITEFLSKASQNHVDKAARPNDVSSKRPKFKKEFRTKKQRKIMKERKVVEKEFQEADAIVDHEHRDKMQAETLKLVFVTYFRILKARVPNLMGAVLEGLAKYAHLINQDFFGDLLEALKDLVSDAEALVGEDSGDEDKDGVPNANSQGVRDSTREALLCITTAFALLEGQDAARSATSLNLDLTFFTSHLYKSLHALSLNPELELSSKSLRLPDPHAPAQSTSTLSAPRVNLQTTTVLLLRALTSTLTPRAVPPIRLAAFSKQLFTSSLHLPEKSTLAMLSLLNNVTKIHGRKIASLWNTEERRGDGVFDATRPDLEGSNPFASTVWEGELLKLHYAPNIRESMKNIEKIVGSVK